MHHCVAGDAYVGEYEGKAAFFGYVHTESVAIFELPLDVSDVRYHRVYRVNGTVDDEGVLSSLEPIADRCFGSSYTRYVRRGKSLLSKASIESYRRIF